MSNVTENQKALEALAQIRNWMQKLKDQAISQSKDIRFESLAKSCASDAKQYAKAEKTLNEAITTLSSALLTQSPSAAAVEALEFISKQSAFWCTYNAADYAQRQLEAHRAKALLGATDEGGK